MAKRKRQKKRTVFGVIEGKKRENDLLIYLKEIYLDTNQISFKISPHHGGNPDRLLAIAIKNRFCYDQIFVWIDEDKDLLLEESKEKLFEFWQVNDQEKERFFSCPLRELQNIFNTKRKSPILIVSQPICVESLIFRMLGRDPPCHEYDPKKRDAQIEKSKNSLNGLFGKKQDLEFYKEQLTIELLEERRQCIPELDLLISVISI